MAVIEDRKATRPTRSYTAGLFDGGIDAIGAKIREEAGELVEAARAADAVRQHVVHEAADLTYHLFVLLAACGVGLADVEQELARRFGTSGLEEKASREDR
ncbi:MAG: phosphoribosyl-ATP diphosphatase [Pirellulales bacterium]|nr:phosphoribosyl-ATP diphosphatase [Pirellulales bacterium]